MVEKRVAFSFIVGWRVWTNGFVNKFLSGEYLYHLFSEKQPQYLYGKQLRIGV